MHRIMVATDGSEGADRAIDMAADLAKDTSIQLIIITAMDASVLRRKDIDKLARAEGGIGEAIEAIANDVLRRAKERAHQKGAGSVEIQFCWGDPVEAILETVQTEQVDAIVVGRRGLGTLASLLLGSVSRKLVQLAPCPVIVVP